MKRIGWIVACLAVLVLQSGCHPTEKTPSGDLRVVNAVVDAESLDVLVDDSAKATGIAADVTASASSITQGTHDIKIRSSTTGAQLLDKQVAFSGATQTMVLYGHRSAISVMLLTDATTSPSSGKLKVRTANLSPEAPLVDTYVTSTDIASAAATISGVGVGASSDFVEISPGNAVITFTTAGTQDILFQSPTRAFTAGATVTFLVFPSAGGKLVNAVVVNTGGDSAFVANASARVKAVNAIADSTLLNYKADGATLLSNVPFGASSTYVTTAAAAHSLQIEAANVPGVTIVQASRTLDPARDYSMVAVGHINQPAVLVLADENYTPAASSARLRFVNALDGGASVDALVNFASQTTGIAPNSASAYFTLAQSTTYTLAFTTSGGVTVLASLTPAELDAAGVYTFYLLGTAAAPQARLVRDR
jgi:hypothetical protein